MSNLRKGRVRLLICSALYCSKWIQEPLKASATTSHKNYSSLNTFTFTPKKRSKPSVLQSGADWIRTEQAACSTIWEMTVLLSGGVMDKGEQNTKSGHKACEEKGAEDEGRLEPTLTSSCVATPCKPD